MSLPQKHEWLCSTADRVLVPCVGVGFLLVSALMAFLGRATFNGAEVSYADEPFKFAGLVGGFVGLGLLCIGYGVLRLVFGSFD